MAPDDENETTENRFAWKPEDVVVNDPMDDDETITQWKRDRGFL